MSISGSTGADIADHRPQLLPRPIVSSGLHGKSVDAPRPLIDDGLRVARGIYLAVCLGLSAWAVIFMIARAVT